MIVTPSTWHKLEPLLTEALDMEEAFRGPWLARVQASHPDIGPLLAKMVAAHDRAERAEEMETVPRLAPPPPSAFSPGDRIGPFRLQRAIGRGGMGEVWLAEQADGRVVREVALKLPRLDASEMRAERFQRERDILAKLSHPNIARLYDAGVSDAGQPYLAMEYVDGEMLDAYIAKRTLPLAARLALFRQVLGAVAHAHRHLIVHRDLKPANILVDAAGQVKLLDFGIAKLLEDEASAVARAARDLTRMGGRVMTLRYAAPEQVSEGSITTATDIYSLGVVLHEMLTGESPYRALREGRRFTAMALLQEDIGAPSRLTLSPESAQARGVATPRQLARLVAGDLDAILLKALRDDSAERYASVALLDEDIERHLQRRPVRARAGTWRYLAGRFAMRHRLPMALAATVLVTLAAGLFVADRERRLAVAERARAERHFASVRKLANSFIFDVHGEIEHLSGALKAREMLVKTSLEYLDALFAEGGNDPALTYELAVAYRRIGDIKGQPAGNNVGDLAAALANYEKARRLFTALDLRKPNDIDALREHTTLGYALARAYFLKPDPRWREEIVRTAALAERVALLPGATPRDRGIVPMTMMEHAHLASLLAGHTPEVEQLMAKALSMQEALVREMPGELNLRRLLSSSYERASGILGNGERTPERSQRAIEYRRKSLALIRDLIAQRPGDRFRGAELGISSGLASLLGLAGELREADAIMAQALALGRELRTRDPENVELAWDVLRALVQATMIKLRMGDPQGALRMGREAMAIFASVPEGSRTSRDARALIAEAKAYLGLAVLASAGTGTVDGGKRLALFTEARDLLAAAMAFVAELRAANMNPYSEEDVKPVADGLAQSEKALARLRAKPGS